jgi:hypothetical protein
MRIQIRNHVQIYGIWLRGKIKGLSYHGGRRALSYSQGIGLSNASGLHLNMGSPHWGGVHKKGNEATAFPEYILVHQKEIRQTW